MMRRPAAPILGAMLLALFLIASPCHAADAIPQAPANGAVSLGEVKTVRAGDIDISYRIKGEGFPLILITGYSATMDMWDPQVIDTLAAHYKVVLFDNRGMGGTGMSDKPFTIDVFADDVRGLMDALEIKKAHVLGWSMGTFIGIETALKYPERIEKLILFAGNCGWSGPGVVLASPEVNATLMDLRGTKQERAQRLISILFPKKWLDEHPDFVKGLPRPGREPDKQVLEGQQRAIRQWRGACERLDRMTQPTLVMTGTEDVVMPPANSLNMATRIPGAWLVRLPGGHSMLYQHPRTFARCILTFLAAETK